jgi:hypothetical protein
MNYKSSSTTATRKQRNATRATLSGRRTSTQRPLLHGLACSGRAKEKSMIVSTMRAILDDAITGQQLQDHYLYLVGDGETLFYIG